MNYKVLVNKDNPYNKNYFSNRKLLEVENICNKKYYLEKKTLKAFLELKKALEQDNIYIDITAGYRTIEDQQKLVFDYTKIYGCDYVKNYVANANYSEHHTGLCFDIGLIIDNKLIIENSELLKYNDTLKKIIKLLPQYGLILRYPKNKEKITDYSYEPWHYRYVGVSTANIITNNNLTLEEYHNLYNKSGVLLVNKPKGLTSRDVVNKIEKIYDTKKVGHNGTLDPLAEGLLIVTINRATKINELLTSVDKEYIATVKVGIETDTLDIEGNVIKESKEEISKDKLDTLFKEFPKTYYQTVPKYSAIKIKGKKLYEYARKNLDIDLPKRKVIIKNLELLEYTNTSFKFKTIVSKGTYIRSLIKDMGDFLNISLTMESLIRTRQGKYSLTNAVTLDTLSINNNLITIKDALDIETKEVLEKDYKKVLNGANLNNNYNVKDKVIFLKDNQELAIYQNINNSLKCYKMLKEIV